MANGNETGERKVRANAVVTTTIDEVTNRLTFEVRGAGTLTLNLATVSQANRDYAALHGFKQRIADAAAIPRDEDGVAASPLEKYEAMAALIEHYESGAEGWTRARAAGAGGGRDTSGLTLRAMARVWPERDPEELVAGIMAKRGIDRKAALGVFAKSDKVLAAIAEIKAAASSVDADDLLDEIG